MRGRLLAGAFAVAVANLGCPAFVSDDYEIRGPGERDAAPKDAGPDTAGCGVKPHCDDCVGCVANCVCQTGSASACLQSCGPMGDR